MAKTDNHRKQYRIFDRTTHTWYEVVPEQYKEFDQWRTNLRKREQYWNRCFCPRSKWWLCDGNCLDCEFHNNTTDSLDDPLPDGEGTLEDYVPCNAPTPEEIVSDRILLKLLIDHLRENDPDADQIIQIWKDNPDGISDRKVAQMLGRAQRTFAYEMKKFRADCKKIRGDED